ncbi:MAG: guanine deaminase [Burkholderiaceae bacterium]|nr:guanine deaminase [Burkholderiaceae bacterium]
MRDDEARCQAHRATLVDFTADPRSAGAGARRHLADGLLVVREGRVEQIGTAAELLGRLGPDTRLIDHGAALLMPGFVDTHLHYAQTDMIASHGERLLEWLQRYTFPTERAFSDPEHAREVAGFFVDELLRNGTTSAMAFATVHPASVDAIFAAAEARSMCLIAGKVMMDRNCPDDLRDTARSGYDDSAALIERWHGRGRLRYAVTPRFAPTSSDDQLRAAGQLLDDYPGVYLQSHLAENADEVRWVAELFPWSRSYLDVYERFGLLRERAVYAHCIHLAEDDLGRMAGSGAAVSFCPTSNLFLGSGLFDLERATGAGTRVGVGTDVGAGTSFSILRTLDEAYKVAQLGRAAMSPLDAFYLATRGGARALRLEDELGSFEPGCFADFVVIDSGATPLLARRWAQARDIDEKLFLLMTLGDDRAIAQTWVKGRCVHRRAAAGGDAPAAPPVARARPR